MNRPDRLPPLALIGALVFNLGLLTWVYTGHYEWAAGGAGALLVLAATGAVIDHNDTDRR